MILTKTKLRLKKSGTKWKQAYINVARTISDMLGHKDQEVLMILVSTEEALPTAEELHKALTDYGNYLQAKHNIAFMKKDIELSPDGSRTTVEELFQKERLR